MEELYYFSCPHCWQRISMLVDVSVREQSYIEDCEVCCNPIQITYTTDGTAVDSFSADMAQ